MIFDHHKYWLLPPNPYVLSLNAAEGLISARDWDVHPKLWSDVVITTMNCSNFLRHMSYDFNVCAKVSVQALGTCFRTEPLLKILLYAFCLHELWLPISEQKKCSLVSLLPGQSGTGRYLRLDLSLLCLGGWSRSFLSPPSSDTQYSSTTT